MHTIQHVALASGCLQARVHEGGELLSRRGAQVETPREEALHLVFIELSRCWANSSEGSTAVYVRID